MQLNTKHGSSSRSLHNVSNYAVRPVIIVRTDSPLVFFFHTGSTILSNVCQPKHPRSSTADRQLDYVADQTQHTMDYFTTTTLAPLTSFLAIKPPKTALRLYRTWPNNP